MTDKSFHPLDRCQVLRVISNKIASFSRRNKLLSSPLKRGASQMCKLPLSVEVWGYTKG
jgi:hypothetical protein